MRQRYNILRIMAATICFCASGFWLFAYLPNTHCLQEVELRIESKPDGKLFLKIAPLKKDKQIILPTKIIVESINININRNLGFGGGEKTEIKLDRREINEPIFINITCVKKKLAYFIGGLLEGNGKRPIIVMPEGAPAYSGENWKPINLDIDTIKTFSFSFSFSGFGKDNGIDIRTNDLPLTKNELKNLLNQYSIKPHLGYKFFENGN